MHRLATFVFLFLAIFFLTWMNLSKKVADRIKEATVEVLTPTWCYAKNIKEYLSDRPLGGVKQADSEELARLLLENQRLKGQVEWVKEWILYDAKVHHEKRSEYLSHLLLQSQLNAIPAQVIYRDLGSWSNMLWIGVGEEDNKRIGYCAVARNSPVMDGPYLVGVIDYVGKKQSRVRLITDPEVTLAARVARRGKGGEVGYKIDDLCHELKRIDDRFELISQLQEIKEKIETQSEEIYLAKGILSGNGSAFWRVGQPLLKGTGFNYDYADAEGAPRDLRTGRPLTGAASSFPLILKGDLLITSGLDGIFPFGLKIATVKKVHPLKEGNFFYEIEATPMANSLNDFQAVFVLPPLNAD